MPGERELSLFHVTALPPPGVVGVVGVRATRCIFSREDAIESSFMLSPYALPVPSDLQCSDKG